MSFQDYLTFVEKLHHGQFWRGQPYSAHLLAVVGIVKTFAPPDKVDLFTSAAIFHDVLEDTSCSLEELQTMLPKEVCDLVIAVTDPDGPTRKARKEKVLPKLLAAGPDAWFLKCCDRLANVQACIADEDSRFQMYRKEWPALCEIFRSQETDKHFVILHNYLCKVLQHEEHRIA
jgi:(p)ppGpp synthase/HD superfamily hydrolase